MIDNVLITTIEYFFDIIFVLILVRIVLSYLPQYQSHQLAQMVFGITEPILAPFKRFIPPIGMLDLSPMVAILVLGVLQRVLIAAVSIAFGVPF